VNGDIWVGTDFNNAAYPFSKLYKLNSSGVIIDSLATPYDFNHGTAWDGTGFWIAEDFRSAGARIYKINSSGVQVDNIQLPALIGGNSSGVGGIEIVGNSLWFSIYYPDNSSYPYAYAYEMNLTTRLITDTIPLRGNQVQGITVKGDTIFYVNYSFGSTPTPERIYAYSLTLGDTLFSFPTPSGNDKPKGLHWDGQYLWLLADSIGGSYNSALYKYDLYGQGNPVIATSSSELNFGNVIIDSSKSMTLTISNQGNADLIITNFNITNPRFTISPNSLPDTIAPSAGKDYAVTFTPNVFDTTSGQLKITSNDGGTPVKIVTLKGKGVYNGAQITLSTSSYNFNLRRENSLCGYAFEIMNQGSEALLINSANFSTDRFWFDTMGVSFPINIPIQTTQIFRIWFNPNSAATFSDSLTLNSNAVNMNNAVIHFSGTGTSSPTALGDIFWQGIIPDNPNTSYNDPQPKSMKQISDVNNDGVNDVLVATENYWTICYNGNSSVTADTLWKFNSHFGSINTGSVDWQDAMQVIEDINNDGIEDVIIGCGGGNEMVYALSGSTGQKIWEFGSPTTTADGDIYGLRTDKDYNNDNVNDVLISASGSGYGAGRHAVICVNGLNGQVIFNVVQSFDFTYDVLATESGGAIGVGNNGGPYRVNGFNNSGQPAWNYPLSGSLNALWSLREIPDINGDAGKDIIGLYGFSGSIFALTGNSGTQIWTQSLGQSNNGTFELLDDLDGNGFIDFTLSAPKVAYRIDSKTDSVLWSYALGCSYIRGVADIGDVSGDTLNDIVFITQQPAKVFVFNGADATIMFEYSYGTSIAQRGDRVTALQSIDGNASNEFVTGNREGKIICFSGGPNGTVSVKPINNIIPDKFELSQNYPNPFNPKTKIKFDLPNIANVKLTVYDILGREVMSLIDSELKPGIYEVTFDGSNLSSGIYFFHIAIHSDRLTTKEFNQTKKMLLVK
jgi:outer membrane protein assembly factor BamB